MASSSWSLVKASSARRSQSWSSGVVVMALMVFDGRAAFTRSALLELPYGSSRARRALATASWRVCAPSLAVALRR